MDNVRDALLRMVKSAKKLKRMADAFDAAGIGSETLFSCYGDVIDAIFHLIGEKTDTYENSWTCLVMNTGSLSDDRAVALLMNAYRKNVEPEIPAPSFISEEQARKMKRGYMSPEGDWL